MSTYEVRFRLKKPILVYVLAFCFIIAPLANILTSMVSSGVHGWYSPEVFGTFLHRISWVDWSWLALTLIAGLCLLRQNRWTWLLALGSLAVASAFNFHYGMKFSTHLAHGRHFFPLLFMLSNLAILVILYHFRFPYLDRREAWWGIPPRYRCRLSASADGGDGRLAATVTNISMTGAYLEMEGGKQPFKEGSFITLHLSSVSALKTEVVRAANSGIGVQFMSTADQKKEIKKLIGSLSEVPMGNPAFSVKS